VSNLGAFSFVGLPQEKEGLLFEVADLFHPYLYGCQSELAENNQGWEPTSVWTRAWAFRS
jgi:hypothetical protein